MKDVRASGPSSTTGTSPPHPFEIRDRGGQRAVEFVTKRHVPPRCGIKCRDFSHHSAIFFDYRHCRQLIGEPPAKDLNNDPRRIFALFIAGINYDDDEDIALRQELSCAVRERCVDDSLVAAS